MNTTRLGSRYFLSSLLAAAGIALSLSGTNAQSDETAAAIVDLEDEIRSLENDLVELDLDINSARARIAEIKGVAEKGNAEAADPGGAPDPVLTQRNEELREEANQLEVDLIRQSILAEAFESGFQVTHSFTPDQSVGDITLTDGKVLEGASVALVDPLGKILINHEGGSVRVDRAALPATLASKVETAPVFIVELKDYLVYLFAERPAQLRSNPIGRVKFNFGTPSEVEARKRIRSQDPPTVIDPKAKTWKDKITATLEELRQNSIRRINLSARAAGSSGEEAKEQADAAGAEVFANLNDLKHAFSQLRGE